MTGQPDLAAVLAWAARVVRDAEYLGAALRGEPTPAVDITSTPALAQDEVHPRLCSLPHGHAGGHWWDESKAADLAEAEASQANPYGPVRGPEIIPARPRGLASLREREHYDGREVAGGAEPDDQSLACDCGWPGGAA